jgi:hypothetical protein
VSEEGRFFLGVQIGIAAYKIRVDESIKWKSVIFKEVGIED